MALVQCNASHASYTNICPIYFSEMVECLQGLNLVIKTYSLWEILRMHVKLTEVVFIDIKKALVFFYKSDSCAFKVFYIVT